VDELTRELYPDFVAGREQRRRAQEAAAIAERRRILCGTEDLAETAGSARHLRLAAARRKRDQRLVRAIGRWRT
jgi:hypothetical protein